MDNQTEALASRLRIHRAMAPKDPITLDAADIGRVLDVFDRYEEALARIAELEIWVVDTQEMANDAWDAYMAVLCEEDE